MTETLIPLIPQTMASTIEMALAAGTGLAGLAILVVMAAVPWLEMLPGEHRRARSVLENA